MASIATSQGDRAEVIQAKKQYRAPARSLSDPACLARRSLAITCLAQHGFSMADVAVWMSLDPQHVRLLRRRTASIARELGYGSQERAED